MVKISDEDVKALANAFPTEDVVNEESPIVEEAQETVNESTTVEDIEEPTTKEVVVENRTEESFIDEVKEEPKEVKRETVKKKVAVPFINEKQKAIYNALRKDPDADIVKVGMLFNKAYENMSPEALMRAEIENDPINAKLSKSDIDFLYERKIAVLTNGLDPDVDENFDRKVEILLTREASRIRQALEIERSQVLSALAEESEFEVEEDESISPEEIELERQNLIKKYDETFNPFLQQGILKIKDKDGIVNIPVIDKGKIAEAAADPVGFMKSLVLTESGDIDFKKFISVVNYALNPSSYNSALITYGISVGKEGMIKEIKNTKTPESRPRDIPTDQKSLESIADLEVAFQNKFGRR